MVANMGGEGRAPMLRSASSRATLIRWLEWNDPNGVYSDSANRVEGSRPLTLNEAWELVAEQTRDR